MNPVLRRVRRAATLVQQRATQSQRLKDFSDLQADGFPPELIPPVLFLVDGQLPDADDARVRATVESIRTRLADGTGQAEVLYSPTPGSAGEDVSVGARPDPGKSMHFDLTRIATETSVGPRWGQFLYLVCRASQATTAVELGSCAGISGAYIASAPRLQRFITIEGSADLAAHARHSIQQVKPDAEVINALFDDALDDLMPTLSDVGFAWIDGHHERVATIHYFQRLIPSLAPGAMVLFDDISWSQDMRDGWHRLAAWPGFAHTIDLGKLGIGLWAGDEVTPRQWDLRQIVGQPTTIGRPHGWQANRS